MINTRWAVEAALERLGVTSETTRVYEMYRLENTGSVVATRKAKEKGLTVVFPEENELFIDIDDDSSMRMYVKNSPLIWRHLGVEKETIRASKSPKHEHVVMKLSQKVSPLERLVLQACLGSDRTRELFSYLHYLDGDPNPFLFFEKEEEK